MKHFLLLAVGTMLCVTTMYAQGENNFWTFGKGGALDFNSGRPIPTGSACNTYEGTASMCGKNGALKFYSDGDQAFNRLHKPMPHGSGLLTDLSVTQGVVIVPFVEDTNKFYLFVLHDKGDIGAARYLNYSVVDMRLDGGMGDILPDQKNITIDKELSEKMIVTKAADCGYWVLVHSRQAEFHAFKISSAGVSLSPVSSATDFTTGYSYGIGEMKVSPDNKKIAIANWVSRGYPGSIELFDFDYASGLVTNYTLVDSSSKIAAYGIQFSPDNSKLYAAYGEDDPRGPYPLMQYDLSLLPDAARVRAEKTVIATAYNWGGMRAYRDKVYAASLSGAAGIHVSVVNKPNEPGIACAYAADAAVLTSTGASLGNAVPETEPEQTHSHDTLSCQAITLSGVPGSLTYVWNDGNTGSSRILTAPAAVWVHSGGGSCRSVVDSFRIRGQEGRVDLGSVLCEAQAKVLDAVVPADAYLWQNGATTKSIEVAGPGTYWVQASLGDCIMSDTVEVMRCELCMGIPNSFTPNKDGINDDFLPILSCPVQRYQLLIMNRWGQQVFLTNDFYKAWDGSFNGAPLDMGTYFYMVKVLFRQPGVAEELYKGTVSLIR